VLDTNSNDAHAHNPDLRWLALGALAGLLMAGYGILRQDSPSGTLPLSAVASVNDVNISRDHFVRTLQRIAPDGGTPSAETQAAIIEKLIDDELLLQRGVELGMAQSDGAVRMAIINSLIASVTAEADAANPTDAELAKYLADNADRFSRTAKVAVNGWQTDDESLAQIFAASLRDDNGASLVDGVAEIADLPTALMPLEAVRDYLGPGITAAVADMPVNSSAVFARRGRWVIVHVLRKESAVAADLQAIRNRVLVDYRRNRADELLGKYLDGLRDSAEIRLAAP
jgi:hypothetical protein